MDRRSFPTTTDTRKIVRTVDAATELSGSMDWTAAISHMPTFDVNSRFQEGEFRQHQTKRNASPPPTCPASRAQKANFALTLEMLVTSFQLIWTAVIGSSGREPVPNGLNTSISRPSSRQCGGRTPTIW